MVDLAANALTTLATAKEDLGISGIDDDDKLKRYINAASDFAEKFCGRVFWRDAAIVEKVKGYGYVHLVVARTPINSIGEITFRDSTVDSDDYEIDDADAGTILKSGGWNWTAHVKADMSRGIMPGTERKLYEVTYDGGFYTPKQEDDTPANVRTLPWDLEEAVLEIVRTTYLAKARDPSVKSEKLLSWGASYGSVLVPDSAKTAMQQHRRAC